MGEMLLDYTETFGWFAETGTMFLHMTDATFQRHVNIYVANQGITRPTSNQLMEARQHCRRLSFWEGCNDPEVHRRSFGR